MREEIFVPDFSMLKDYKVITRDLFGKFISFTQENCTDFDDKAEKCRNKFWEDMKNLVAQYISLNYNCKLGEGNRMDSDWKHSCNFVEANFDKEAMFQRHLIYNSYASFLAVNPRNSVAAGGSYDTSFVSMIIVLVGKNIIESIEFALDEGDPSWSHAWIIKMCRRKMDNFLPGTLYTRNRNVSVRTL